MAKCTQNDLRMHLLQSRTLESSTPPPTIEGGGKPPSQTLPHLRLRRSVLASGTRLSPYFIN
jgi:hypothetical protein